MSTKVLAAVAFGAIIAVLGWWLWPSEAPSPASTAGPRAPGTERPWDQTESLPDASSREDAEARAGTARARLTDELVAKPSSEPTAAEPAAPRETGNVLVRLVTPDPTPLWDSPMVVVTRDSNDESRSTLVEPPHQGEVTLALAPGPATVRLFDTPGDPRTMYTGFNERHEAEVLAGGTVTVEFDVVRGGRLEFEVGALELPSGGKVSLRRGDGEELVSLRPLLVDPLSNELSLMLVVTSGKRYVTPVLPPGAVELLVHDRSTGALAGRVSATLLPGERRWVEFSREP